MNNDRVINISTSVAVVFMLLSLLAAALMGTQQLDKLFHSRDTVIHTHETLSALDKVFAAVQGAESAERGYLLTHKREYLTPFKNASREIDATIVTLRSLLDDDAAQSEKVQLLSRMVHEQLDDMNARLDAQAKVNTAPVLADAGQTKMNELRLLVQQMKTTQDELLQQRSQDLAREASETLLKQLFLVGIAVTFLLCMSSMVTIFLKARRSAQEQLQSVLASVGEGVCRLDDKGKITYLNLKAEELLGYSLRDVRGRDLHDLVHTHHGREIHCHLLKLLTENSTGDILSEQFARHDGSLMPVEFISAPIVQDGKVTGTVASFYDVTSKMRIQFLTGLQHAITQTLTESATMREAIEKVLKQICDQLQCEAGAFWALKPEEKKLNCLDFYVRPDLNMVDFETASLMEQFEIGQGLPGRVAASGTALTLTNLQERDDFTRAKAAEKANLRSAFAFPIGTGSNVIGVLEFFTIKDYTPEPETLALFAGISNQLGLYLDRKKAEEELRDSERRYRSVFDTAPDGIVTLNAEGRIESANAAAHKILRFQHGELLHKNVDEVMPDLLKQTRAQKEEDIFITGGKKVFYRDYETRALRKDSSSVPLEAAVSKAMLRNREVTTVVIRDITERKEVEKRVAEFYSIVSHELRTPLTSIRGSLGLLEGGRAGSLSSRGQQLVTIARSEAERLIRLVNDILDIRKVEAGKLELRIQDCLASDVATLSIDAMAGMAASASVEISKTFAFDATIKCDKERLEQVLTNLLANAIKFSQANASVEVRIDRGAQNKVRFSVVDEAGGIPKEQMHKLFGMFQQIDSSDSRPKEGSGLGLAISKAIIELHKGHIGVESKEGAGSTFWFELPIRIEEEKGTATTLDRVSRANEEVLLQAKGSADQTRSRILIVEDDATTRELITQELSALDVDCLLSRNGEEALSLARSHHPNLIILDLGVPAPDGFELVDILKKEHLSGVPLIVYTARDLTAEDKSRLELGQSAHLVKSRATQADLLDTVKRLLNTVEKSA